MSSAVRNRGVTPALKGRKAVAVQNSGNLGGTTEASVPLSGRELFIFALPPKLIKGVYNYGMERCKRASRKIFEVL